jgi:hypothetical protein
MWNAVFESRERIDNVLATSFNEWMAIKYANAFGRDMVFFVDVFNHEFSRDIEMMRGGYNDNFYLQLVRNVRKFKLTDSKHYRYPLKTMDIRKSTYETWKDVNTAYVDFTGDAIGRNFTNAVGTEVFTDSSNRNDIAEIKVIHDKKNLYFMIKTLGDITVFKHTDVNWMNILISNGGNADSFAGYQYIVNRKPDGKHKTSVEMSVGGYNWKDVAQAKYSVKGNLMQVAIPLSALGLNVENCSFEFKIADNVTHYDDIMDYYVTGDSAPLGRLNFSYGY